MTTPTRQPRAGARHPGRTPASGMLAARHWLVSTARRHPMLADAALAAALLVLSVPPFTGLTGGNRALSLALTFAMICPLVWRRRAPFLVMVIVTGLAYVQLFTRQPLTDYLAVLIAFYTVTARSSRWRVLAAAVALAGSAVLVTRHMHSAAGHKMLVWALSTGLIAGAGLLGYYVRTARRAQLVSQAERAERAEREREHQAQLAVSAERARIAREMHDIVAHNIAVMIALAEGAACTSDADPAQAATLMGQVSATGRTALTEMRRLLGVLRQPAVAGYAPQPGLADLDDLLATVRAAGQAVDLAVSGQPFPLPPSAQLALYRMIQEALTNSLKHAAGAPAVVQVTYLDGGIGLEVTDGGRPGEVPGDGRPGAGSGHGIAGMRERAAVFGGEVSAGPRPGGGWRVHTVLHIEPAAAGSIPAPAGGDTAPAAGGRATGTEGM